MGDVTNDQLDAPTGWNRIRLGADVQHASRKHEQVCEPQDGVAVARHTEGARHLDVIPRGIGRGCHCGAGRY